MDPSPADVNPLSSEPPRPLSARALAALTSELSRHPGPKNVAVVGDDPGVIEHVLDLLGPKDELVIWVPDALAAVGVRARVATRSRFVTDRVSVWDEAPVQVGEWADFVVGAGLLGPDVDAALVALRRLANPQAVVSVMTTALGTADRATALARLFAAGVRTEDTADLGDAEPFVVRRDLVLRNSPPVYVHHLRFAVAEPALAESIAPVARPSSVSLSERLHLDSNGVAAAAALGALTVATRLIAPKSKAWLVPAVATGAVTAFFRDPQRRIDEDPQLVVAASDGRVLSVSEVTDPSFTKEQSDWLRIAVFLSVLDVHVNRSPVAGRVERVLRGGAGYAMAQNEAAEHNVAQYTVLSTVHGPVVVAQRTGLIARRIVNRARVGALLAKGERFGLIRFGSRTDVYLPVGAAEPLVVAGDRVVGGETVLARWAS